MLRLHLCECEATSLGMGPEVNTFALRVSTMHCAHSVSLTFIVMKIISINTI